MKNINSIMSKFLIIVSIFVFSIIISTDVRAAENSEALLNMIYLNDDPEMVYFKDGATKTTEIIPGHSYESFKLNDPERHVYTVKNMGWSAFMKFIPDEISEGATVTINGKELDRTGAVEVNCMAIPYAKIDITSEDGETTNTYYIVIEWGNWGSGVSYQYLRKELKASATAAPTYSLVEPDSVTIEDKGLLEAFDTAYEALSAEEKSAIEADTIYGYAVDTIKADLAKIADLEKEEADKAAAEEFAKQIADLKGDGTDTDEAIAAAKAAYEALSPEAQELAKEDNEKLDAAEKAVADKKAADEAAKSTTEAPKPTAQPSTQAPAATTQAPKATAPAVKKGTTFKVGKNNYKVTKVTKKTGTVTFTKATSKKLAKVTIPATVKYKGCTFKVTEVAKNALKNNKKLTTVTIGKNVTTIGASAFAGDAKLKKITVKSTVLKKVGAKSLKGIHKKAVIKVPKKQLKKYTKLFKGKGQKKTVKVKK